MFAMAVVALLGGAGCGSKPKPPPAAPPPAAAADAAAAATEAPAEPAKPEWSYSSVGKRDPFRSFLTELDKESGSLATRCATPLGRFELEQLRLVAVVTGLEDPVAMVEAPTGVGYSVRRGACIGKNGGTVAAVRTGEVVVSEWAMRADGTRDRTQTIPRLPKEAALTLEE
ncbi:MAG TPA: pilus assembly protein PilP [Anaeromyxobacteraceae bacterium]|nr:pilus assembly protein PilP [Anaeromyxobacteraceae bacterium]